MKLELNSENLNFHLDLIKKMCEENKSGADISKYIEHMQKKSCIKILNNELLLLQNELKTNIFKGWGNINAGIFLAIDKPSDIIYNGGKDEISNNMIASLLTNAAAKLNQKFDTSYIYKSFLLKGKCENKANIGLYLSILEAELKIIKPKYVVCMGHLTSELLIKKDYNPEQDGIYNENPMYVGTYNIFEISQDKNVSMYKKNIWNKFELLKTEIEK